MVSHPMGQSDRWYGTKVKAEQWESVLRKTVSSGELDRFYLRRGAAHVM